MDADTVIHEYLLLGLRFDRVEEGYVDSFTGDPALRRAVESEPAPDPATLARDAERLLAEVPAADGLDAQRADYLAAHLTALACAGRKFAGQDVGFVEEVRAYFDVDIAKGDPDRYRDAHRKLDEALGGSGPLAERMQAHRTGEEIPPERLEECIHAFSSALRDRVRAEYPLPDAETINYEIVTDKPWSGFNYYEGDYKSTVAVNADLKQQMSNLPRLVAHESYPGHHTEHCRKEAGLVARRRACRADDLPGQHPAVPDGGGTRGPGAARGDRAELGVLGDRDLRRPRPALRRRARRGDLGGIRGARRRAAGRGADAARRAPRRRRRRRLHAALAAGQRGPGAAGAAIPVLPLWRAYTSTYVEGYRLLRGWLDARPADVTLGQRFGRLLDEPLIPSSLRT